MTVAALFSSCASISPVTSKPPYGKIVVNRPFTWGDGVLTIKVNMPAGTYLPQFEDKEGYFYQAPQKITGRDTFYPLLVDGGLYLKRGPTNPIRYTSSAMPTAFRARSILATAPM